MSSGLTPYAGTSGWSGSSASEDATRTSDATGRTGAQQRMTLRLLGEYEVIGGKRTGRYYGLTVKDLRLATDLHHGQASRVLSVLHKEGVILRLKERRDNCSVYVLPEFLSDREHVPHGRGKGLTAQQKSAYAGLRNKIRMSDELGSLTVAVTARELRTVLDLIEEKFSD